MIENNSGYLYRSPELAPLPSGCEKRLIDSGMLHYEASVAGYNERYHRGETSHTIHVWWARRPHSAMRSLVYASLAKDMSEESASIMASLAMTNDDETLSAAKKIISSGYTKAPAVLDMFGGGGTIPFESAKLGADTFSIDANQLSVFIQKCNMIYANMIDLDIAKKKVESSGKAVLERLKNDTEWLYPLRKASDEKTFGYMWSYKKKCDQCNKNFYLIKRPWLTTKKGKHLSFIKTETEQGDRISISTVSNDAHYPFAWERRTGKCYCPYCGALQEKIDALKCQDSLLAIINTEKTGKSFELAPDNAVPPTNKIQEVEIDLLREINATLPDSELPVWSGVVNPALYGIKTHSDFLNPRQRLVLIYLIKELLSEYDVLRSEDETMAKFVISVLSSLIDQVFDWNCRLSMWIPVNEQVGRAFCGPGVAMLWDYAETDMLLNGPANIWDKLKRIVKGISSFSHSDHNVIVKHAHAQELPFEDEMFDAIVTDPPYYDNIYYSILADFFFSWKRILLSKIEPDLFVPKITDTKYELVASSRREGRGSNAHESYCIELKQAFQEAARVIKPDGVFSFVYSHSSVNGWDAIIQAYRSSPFVITSVQPLSIERKGRPRSVMSQAVNTCITFIARKNYASRQAIEMSELKEKISEISESFGKQLTDNSGWNSEDAGLAVLAFAVGMIANSSGVIDADSDVAALIEIGKDIKQSFPDFTLKIRSSL